MSYQSIDTLQKLLADGVFSYSRSSKKTAGRALGTFLEIITYYLIKSWQMDVCTAIEQALPEFANGDITHNVEFTLHGSVPIADLDCSPDDLPLNGRAIRGRCPQVPVSRNGATIVSSSRVIKNACTLHSDKEAIINAYMDTATRTCHVRRLCAQPFAMFECKRVGIEEGMKKGPQTIEKAKQGSYVARTVSSLQRIRKSNGALMGVLQAEKDYLIDDYYALLRKIIYGDDIRLLRNFILTVGIVSNHGNWFTSDNPNKELRVLAQSYDWLVFLTDAGLSEFVNDLLLNPRDGQTAAREAFLRSYPPRGRGGNVFTKVNMDWESDRVLTRYFCNNRKRIAKWFNVISPVGKTLGDLQKQLTLLSCKPWHEVYP